MKNKNILRYAFLPAFALCLALTARVALADVIDSGGTTPGCDQKVLTAMQDKANARVAYDVASTEQVTTKPDSILAMTCFNNAAGEAAVDIGSMFSKDFSTPLGNIVPDGLTAFYDDFDGAIGKDTNTIDYTQTALGGAGSITSCNYIQDLWTKVKNTGIQPDVPFYRYSDLVNAGSMPNGTSTTGNGVAPANTTKFYKDWNTSDGTDNDFAKVGTDIGALPKAATPTTFDQYANFQDVCTVMKNATITGSATCP
jgi:hypothetical protein